MNIPKQVDGSRCHVLDWVETPQFVDTVKGWTRDQSLQIPDDPVFMPKSWAQPDESKLFDAASPFLSGDDKTRLGKWWLAHPGIANIPNWDLIVAASTSANVPALVLVEAKAHATEFDCKSKPVSKRKTPVAQKRTDENHEQIGHAIAEAARALANFHSRIKFDRNHCYQLSNRIAMGWKLASMGIANTLVFLGFTGDREIDREGKYFADDKHWQEAFANYAKLPRG